MHALHLIAKLYSNLSKPLEITGTASGARSMLDTSEMPWRDLQSVTPSDTIDLPGGVARGLWIGAAGNVVVVTEAGTTVTIPGVQAGTTLPVFVSRVRATGTTVAAGNILAGY